MNEYLMEPEVYTQVTIQLKENAKPYHTKSFPIPKTHEPTLIKEMID